MPVQTTLHYVFDPLCGWCYGAEPLINAASGLMPVVLHGGGMMAGANRQKVSAQLRAFVMPHDRRIAEYTGQPFGRDYFEGLLRDNDAVFDSQPPIAAILAAEQLAGRGLELLARLQRAHYIEGRRIADDAVLKAIAAEMGLPAHAFASALLEVDSESHMGTSRAFMASFGGQGFPTLVLEREGRLQVIDIGPFLGKPDAFVQWLDREFYLSADANASNPAFCAPNGCDL
ncbi:DsbA family protein [Pseudomonas sp. R32]|uniref:DsbA family protein n=1 Tax=Pseudomonas sp. R32 TaxID=1573704 RepID=UPI00132E91B2|nr:DsbA family protein [Pseudomonas sp. R32]QHF30804.1 protein-disulfide isomerase [Pseudomonas sp. R32]